MDLESAISSVFWQYDPGIKAGLTSVKGLVMGDNSDIRSIIAFWPIIVIV